MSSTWIAIISQRPDNLAIIVGVSESFPVRTCLEMSLIGAV